MRVLASEQDTRERPERAGNEMVWHAGVKNSRVILTTYGWMTLPSALSMAR